MNHALLLGALVALVVFSLLASQTHINGASERITRAEHAVAEGVHGLESWLAHPKSLHHDTAVDAPRHLRGDMAAFLDRLEAVEARSVVFEEQATAAPRPSKTADEKTTKTTQAGLDALAKRVKADEAKLIAEEKQDSTVAKLGRGARRGAVPGKLVCGGEPVEHEVVYWKEVPGDLAYESPITPHHADHATSYLTFEYDMGGWNNIRMGVECVVVLAHATGRTLVAPPGQNLYLLGAPTVDASTGKKSHKKLGFSDFFEFSRLKKQEGMHMLTMAEFLAKQNTEVGAARGEYPESRLRGL